MLSLRCTLPLDACDMLADVIYAGGGAKGGSAKSMRPDAPLACTKDDFCMCEVCELWGVLYMLEDKRANRSKGTGTAAKQSRAK